MPSDGARPSRSDQGRIGGCLPVLERERNQPTDETRVRFPGAINSKFTTEMKFIDPGNAPDIPTFRVIDSDGVLVDKSRGKPKVSNEEMLTWYKNMLTG